MVLKVSVHGQLNPLLLGAGQSRNSDQRGIMWWICSVLSSHRQEREAEGKRHVFQGLPSVSFFLNHAQLLTKVPLVMSSSMPRLLLQFQILTSKPLTREQQRMCLDSGNHIISLCQRQSKLKLIPGFNNFWNYFFKPLKRFKYPFRLPEKEKCSV